MDNSYLNLIVFILTTVLYYLIKPSTTLETSNDENSQSSNYMMLGAYFLVVIISQFFINSYIITSTCGGNVMGNLKDSALYTFIPWTLIFGVVIVILYAYPDIKSAFSDVFGYYYVATSANNIITDLLVNEPVNTALSKPIVEENATLNTQIVEPTTDKINTIPLEQPNKNINLTGGSNSYKGGADPTRDQLIKASDLIIKICGNMSILINQIIPSNFNQYWTMLTPLFKEKYRNDEAALNQKKSELYDLVIARDNVGEGMWYIYTGILLCSLVQFKLSNVGCKSDQQTLENNYKKFKKQQDDDTKLKNPTSI
jgi:hypothetical protein